MAIVWNVNKLRSFLLSQNKRNGRTQWARALEFEISSTDIRTIFSFTNIFAQWERALSH